MLYRVESDAFRISAIAYMGDDRDAGRRADLGDSIGPPASRRALLSGYPGWRAYLGNGFENAFDISRSFN